MSANLIVDLRNTAVFRASIASATGVAGTPASGKIIGAIVDLGDGNTFCNVLVAGGATSGPLGIEVQTSDSLTSGSFTDPTSGMVAADLPTSFVSGGIFWVNSGLRGSGALPHAPVINNAPHFCSGGVDFAAFQRPHRYARINALSGTFDANLVAGFVTQRRTVGSGGGFTYSPGSGSVNV